MKQATSFDVAFWALIILSNVVQDWKSWVFLGLSLVVVVCKWLPEKKHDTP